MFLNEIYVDVLEDQLIEEVKPDLELEKYFLFLYDRDKHWKDIIVEKNEARRRFTPLDGRST